jgi:hypothetical protein
MAVTYTYCRRSIHDEYFFEDPLRLLGGEIQPPQFNLRNDVMLRKHIHATILTELTALSRSGDGNDLPPAAAEEIRDTLRLVSPRFIRDYLFVDGKDYRTVPYDVNPLRTVVSKHAERLRGAVADVFARHWPEEAADDVSPEAIASAVGETTSRLQSTVDILHRRLAWALATQRRLADDKKRRLLDEFEQRLERRCEAYIRGLSKESARNYTLSVLANEGFLPSYGSYNEGVVAFAQRAWARKAEDPTFELSRPPSLAVREFVPGNMIYANGGRFRVALYHFPVGEDRLAPDTYVVDPTSDSIREGSAKADSYASDQEKGLLGVPICDTDLAFIARISDVETYRFQVPVKLIGYLKQGHSGGMAYSLADRELRHMRNQHLRLVNVGPADRVARGDYGYPVCLVCGAVRSPYASDDEFEHFRSRHREACGTEPGWVALSADDRVDGLVIDGFSGRAEAVNLAEALRIGAGQVMEMDSGDLQYIPIPSEDGVRLFFYDPMPGGSGLLSQVLERWGEVNVAAQRALAECSAACEDSCYECMRSYFNMAYHRELNRHQAVELLKQLEAAPVLGHDIPAVAEVQTGAGSSKQSNADRLLQMIERAGFPPPDREQPVKIGKPYGNTVPDFSYRNEAEGIQVAIYLDGLSKGIHGNTERQQIDRLIRQQLEADDWDVIEIANSDLDDLAAMRAALTRLAKTLGEPLVRTKVREQDDWHAV